MTPDMDEGVVPEAARLAERIGDGDRRAENSLVRLYSSRVLAMATIRTRNREAAREIANDVMMAVVTALRRGSVLDPSRLGAFVHGSAVNVINNHFRSRNRLPHLLALDEERFEADSNESRDRDIDVLALRRCLDQLSRADRGVLTLSLVEGLKPGEISGRTGQSSEVVRQRKTRALARLKLVFSGPSPDSRPGPP